MMNAMKIYKSMQIISKSDPITLSHQITPFAKKNPKQKIGKIEKREIGERIKFGLIWQQQRISVVVFCINAPMKEQAMELIWIRVERCTNERTNQTFLSI